MWTPIAFGMPEIISKPFEDYATDLQVETRKVWILERFG
jgi:hypothetical protein